MGLVRAKPLEGVSMMASEGSKADGSGDNFPEIDMAKKVFVSGFGACWSFGGCLAFVRFQSFVFLFS